MGALVDSWHTGHSERQPDPLTHLVMIQPDSAVGADGPDIQAPHDVAGLSAGETGEALSQLIDRVGHAGEALGAGVGLVHEFGNRLVDWPQLLARLSRCCRSDMP